MEIRRYEPGEEVEIWTLYFNTTHQVVSRSYTQEQASRWAPANPDMCAWREKLARTKPFVAVENDKIVGFAELEPDGHIDNFYCHHEWQRRGVGSSLLRALEAEARRTGVAVLFAEVSMTAVAFFRAKDFEITEVRTPIICGTAAKQFLMRKRIRM